MGSAEFDLPHGVDPEDDRDLPAAHDETEDSLEDEHESHKAKIAMGVGALGLMGMATAIAYRNLRKQHKEGN